MYVNEVIYPCQDATITYMQYWIFHDFYSSQTSVSEMPVLNKSKWLREMSEVEDRIIDDGMR
jgi:hypothetical protein